MAQIDARIPLMVQAPQIEPFQNALARSLRNRQMQADADLQQQKISDTNALRQAAMGGKLFTPDGMLAPNALDVVGRMAPGSLPQFAQLAATQQQTMRKNRIQDAEFNMKRQEWLKTGLSSVKSPQEALAYIQSGVQSGIVDPTEAQQWSSQVPQDPGQFNTWITGLNRQLMTPQQRYAADNPGGQVVDTPQGVMIVNPRTGEGRPATQGGQPILGDKATKKQIADEKALKGAKAAISTADTVLKNIDDALGKVGWGTAGFVGGLTSDIRGTPAYDLKKIVTTVKANIGFQQLQAMRDASPTGGALGQVAVQELEALQAVLGSLDEGQSPDQLRASLTAVKQHFESWRNAMREAYGIADEAAVESGAKPDRAALEAEARRRGLIK